MNEATEPPIAIELTVGFLEGSVSRGRHVCELAQGVFWQLTTPIA